MASNQPVEKLADHLKDLVIGASGTIPGYKHGQIKRMVERCGAKFASTDVSMCTHLVTTEDYLKKKSKKINRALELQDCQIVNIDWLLKKIEKHTLESVEKDISNEKIEDTKPTGKKRERESSLGDDQDSPPKKMKDEEQINLKNLSKLVDEEYPKPRDTLAVWQDDTGLIWDATLVRVGLKKQVEVFRIQLLVHHESEMFHTWDLHYEFGSSEDSKSIGNVGNLESAKDMFEEKFELYSGSAWEDRDIPSLEGEAYISLQIHREVPIITDEISPLPAGVENVLKIIFKPGNLKKYLDSLNTYGRNLLSGTKVDKKKLLIGIAVLSKLMEPTNPDLVSDNHSQWRKELCRIYRTLILKNKTFSDCNDTIRQELESLELLVKLCNASEIQEKKCLSSSLAMSQVSQGVIGIFRLERPGEAERFAQWEKANLDIIGDRRLLWHGSKSSNFAGILSQGLRGDGIVSTDGKHFVPGVFFADMATKSAGYCRQKGGEALMLLCEVELGTGNALSGYYAGSTVHDKWRDAGYIHPDFKGCKVPDVHAGTKTARGAPSNLYHSEYIAHSPAQIRQRYLFHVNIV
ncbi:hypothetical protein N7472_004078 [Penicillium cf. griseofulvum]|uniref:Poly [ADP-ribose] polymerase n=1 Tax=Penicillium cf. griseofulvum TaxID=2972120 RepID=A0A9W9JM48_9EURO|nr:hypothetical protein N7472_004078 [Penicillium cf. griseofulvum]KAJ5443168.1 hypothetical protein N7445_004281 [Penicillium cf. griseofulvum]